MLTLIYGENNSGKSDYAERYVMAQGDDRIYLATMLCADADARERIRRHKKLRDGRGFRTVECPLYDPEQLDRLEGNLLLEDLANLVANDLFEPDGLGGEGVEKTLELLIRRCKNVTVVSNTFEQFLRRYYRETVSSEENRPTLSEETLSYIAEIRNWNRRLTELADTVIEVKDKKPIVRKGNV